MKITLNWLKEYVSFEWSPEELAERLTMLGLEVEGVEKIAGEFQGVVVAQVVTRDKHPNADKLSLCRVNDGNGERQIVCGAQNFKAGDKVPLILPGSTLPAQAGHPPVTIKVGKIRGVESQGMLCSAEELGLPKKEDGLLILPENARVGQAFAEFLGRTRGDVVYDLEITPNRPDWNSVIGIARDISALTGNPLRLPEIQFDPAQISREPIEQAVAVRVDDAELCPRYTARLLRGVRLGPSPDWMRSVLEKVGLRSINNVVDATNYVMLEIGQPLHAFDYRLLGASSEPGRAGQPPMIVVRRANGGEEFITLDGKKHTLTDQVLLIADETKPLAIAGIMGGQNSEISATTTDVLLESACFRPQSIRASSKKLELRTDSSYRFERGADVGICDWASRRCAQLILQSAGGTLCEHSIDAYPNPASPKEISLRHARSDALLGISIPAATQDTFLKRLGLEQITESAEKSDFRIPTFRVDLKGEADLIEEVARLQGVDKIPATPPRGAIGTNSFVKIHDEMAEARRILTGLGFYEAQGQTLISEQAAATATGEASKLAILRNPLSSEMSALRPSLLPGLLDTLRHNLRHKNNDVAAFEIGRVFWQAEGKFQEERRLALVLTGNRAAAFWSGSERDAKFDVFDLKGALEEFFEAFGLRGVTWARREQADGFFAESAVIQLGKAPLGQIGELSPAVARQYDLRDAALLAELNFEQLLTRRTPAKSFKSLPQFPSVRRDVAMFVPHTTTHEAVQNVVKQARPANLERLQLFDIFRGKNSPAGQKSMAYAMTYRNAERTLTDDEVNAAHQKLLEQFKQSLQAVIRDT